MSQNDLHPSFSKVLLEFHLIEMEKKKKDAIANLEFYHEHLAKIDGQLSYALRHFPNEENNSRLLELRSKFCQKIEFYRSHFQKADETIKTIQEKLKFSKLKNWKSEGF